MDSAQARRRRFEELAATTYEPVQRYLRRRTDPEAAQDVLAEVLLVLWRRLDEVPADSPLAWTFGVARRCLANHRRGDERRLRLVRRLSAARERAEEPDHSDLLTALDQLPARDREVLRLWAWEQLAPREIAVVLAITPNAASIRLHRATATLREALRKDELSAGHLGQRQGREVEQ